MESKFNELQKKRRSIYAIGENVTADKNDIFNLVKTTIQQSPTAFHSQTVELLYYLVKNQIKYGISLKLTYVKLLMMTKHSRILKQKSLASVQVLVQSFTLQTHLKFMN